MSGYLSSSEILRTKPIKVTPNPGGYESQRLIILMASNGQPWATYLWNTAIENARSEGKQKLINLAIAEEQKKLEHMGLPHSHVDAARSLLVDSGLFELSESGLSIPCQSPT